jgi:hypothetical protein
VLMVNARHVCRSATQPGAAGAPDVCCDALVGVVHERAGLQLVKGAVGKVLPQQLAGHPLPPVQRQARLVQASGDAAGSDRQRQAAPSDGVHQAEHAASQHSQGPNPPCPAPLSVPALPLTADALLLLVTHARWHEAVRLLLAAPPALRDARHAHTPTPSLRRRRSAAAPGNIP